MGYRRLFGVLGLVGVWVGAVLAVDGPTGLIAVALVLAANAGLVLLGFAGAILAYNIAPRGTLIGPAVLAATGLLLLAFRYGWWSTMWTWPLVGTVLAVGGGFLAMTRQPLSARPPEPVHRVVGALAKRQVTYTVEDFAPERLRVLAVCDRVRVDLRVARPPHYGPMEVFVTCILATVDLVLPSHWPIVAGRVNTTWGTHLDGRLDSTEFFDDPQDEGQDEALTQLVSDRQRAVGTDVTGVAVVVHVIGIRSAVSVRSG